MNLQNIKTVYFLGIGGIGMSAIARYFRVQGKQVLGYDKTPTPLTAELLAEGIEVHFEDDIDIFKSQVKSSKEETLVVLTPAIPRDHQEWQWLKEQGYAILKRSQVLGVITSHGYTVAVAGTHGKTTTSSIVAHLLKTAQKDITAFLGGIAKNYNSNFILPVNKGIGSEMASKDIVVVEADEYDRSFLTLYPDVAVITSMDADHLDIYGSKDYMDESYRLFASQVKQEGTLIVKAGLDLQRPPGTYNTYSINTAADYQAVNIRIVEHEYVFDLKAKGEMIPNLSLGLPGIHNVENAVAASAIALQMGIGSEMIRTGLRTYTGVKRRFDYQLKTKDLVYLDDYAHHPEELRACITSVRELYPEKKITGVFQPHLYSRTRDFVDGFGESLSLLDELILLDIYPARELPIPGVTSQIIYDRVTIQHKSICTKANLLNLLKEKKLEVLLTLGAGDIDTFVQPIKKHLEGGVEAS